MSEIEDRLKKLEDLIKIQADDGNWNYNDYMYGLLNGMLLAQSVFDDKTPDYPDAPNQWISDLETLDKFNKSGAVVK